MKLNLETTNENEVIIKAYLEKNASETLADKINNGVLIEKDGFQLINKKTLSGFMQYANGEAQKLAKQGARACCVKDEIVYGWAIHYFEEDSIEENLYKQDGTEYKVTKPIPTVQKAFASSTTTTKKKKFNEGQFSLFDMMLEEPKEEKQEEVEDDDEYPSEEEIQDALQQVYEEEQKPKYTPSPVYAKYLELQKQYPEYIIAYKLGDFYEIIGENAVRIANALDLTLTGRDCGLENRVPMVGFPYHVADKYFEKMAINHKVARCNSLGDIVLYPPENEEFDLTEEEMREFDGDICDGEIPMDGNIDERTATVLFSIFGKNILMR